MAFCWFSQLEEKPRGSHGLPCGRRAPSWPPLPLLVSPPAPALPAFWLWGHSGSQPKTPCLGRVCNSAKSTGNADFPGEGQGARFPSSVSPHRVYRSWGLHPAGGCTAPGDPSVVGELWQVPLGGSVDSLPISPGLLGAGAAMTSPPSLHAGSWGPIFRDVPNPRKGSP